MYHEIEQIATDQQAILANVYGQSRLVFTLNIGQSVIVCVQFDD